MVSNLFVSRALCPTYSSVLTPSSRDEMSVLDPMLTQWLRKFFETTRMQLRPRFTLLRADSFLTPRLRSQLF